MPDPTSLPVLTAIATLIAATIGGVVAVVVSLINARSSRRLAIDAAHRQYRDTLSASSVQAARTLLSLLYELRSELQRGIHGRDSSVAAALLAPQVKTDFRTPNDEVFSAIIDVFVLRRQEVRTHLTFLIGKPGYPTAEILTEMAAHIREVCEALDLAAEAYVFGLEDVRNRAATKLAKLRNGNSLNVRLSPIGPEEPEF